MRSDDVTLLLDHLSFVREAGQSPGELGFPDFVEVRLDGRRDGGS